MRGLPDYLKVKISKWVDFAIRLYFRPLIMQRNSAAANTTVRKLDSLWTVQSARFAANSRSFPSPRSPSVCLLTRSEGEDPTPVYGDLNPRRNPVLRPRAGSPTSSIRADFARSIRRCDCCHLGSVIGTMVTYPTLVGVPETHRGIQLKPIALTARHTISKFVIGRPRIAQRVGPPV